MIQGHGGEKARQHPSDGATDRSKGEHATYGGAPPCVSLRSSCCLLTQEHSCPTHSTDMADSGFEKPEFYNFPPFFTLQPVLATREKQLRLWCDMVLRWHHARKEYVFEWRDWPLWENEAIGRKLSSEGASAVVEELVRTGHAEWNHAGKSMVTLMWHSAEEIAAKLFDFVRKHDMVGSVFTVYELHQGDEVLGTDFFGMDEGLFRKALSVLESQERVVMFKGATSEEDGVKFLG